MKTLYKITAALLVVLGTTVVSCSSEEAASRSPIINYVRLTDPASSDSLLVEAGQGQLLALIGDNLQDTKEVWFNNLKAFISPTYVTKNSIITTGENSNRNQQSNSIS